ncbi:MAG: hypothetical protein AMXMBFR58_26220 [Phycisphaerae bacterium]
MSAQRPISQFELQIPIGHTACDEYAPRLDAPGVGDIRLRLLDQAIGKRDGPQRTITAQNQQLIIEAQALVNAGRSVTTPSFFVSTQIKTTNDTFE